MATLPVLNESELGGALAAELEALFPGRVKLGEHYRKLYSTDASIYQVEPLGVVHPESMEEVQRLLEWAGKHGVPVLPRGGGTSLAGQCTNRAVVVDYSNHCRKVLGLDLAEKTVHVEPGTTIDDLNRWLDSQQSGLFYAPDPATSAQAAIGGCIGNNAAGARSIRYGRTSENVRALDVILSSGQRVWLESGAGRRNETALRLAKGVAQVVGEYAELIRQRFPKTLRRNAGYALDLILKQMDAGVAAEDLDLTGLICGSEGTLAVVASAKLKLHPTPKSKGLAICSFDSVEEAIDAVVKIVGTGPSAVELLDDVVLEAARGNYQCRQYLRLVPKIGDREPQGVLYVEYQETGGLEEVQAGFERLRGVLPGAAMATYIDGPSLGELWALRKAGEPLLHGMTGRRKPVTAVEDNAIPVENLSRFVREFKKIVTKHGTKAAYFAHASVGVLHVRPLIDLHDAEDRERLKQIAVEVADLARECGGIMSGEHGDGRIRGPLLERYFGPELMEAFRKVKAVFDPAGILNPGMVARPGPVHSIVEELRVTPAKGALHIPEVETFFDYSDQEDFAHAVEMCNGAGVCRKLYGGAMCPSYRATLEERHSTRGRGNALRLAISGQIGNGSGGPAWNDPETMETLRLCLSCKACKTECPSNVDVARLKAEYTAQRYRAEGGAPVQARMFGHIRKLNRLGSIAPGLANWIGGIGFVRRMMNRMLGLAPQRSLPEFAPSLYRWYRKRPAPVVNNDAPRVVLFADCFVTYNEPHIGRAAIELLERLGYRVELPKVGCCGRAMISTGLLEDAIRTADSTLAQLRPYIEDDSVKAILVCEPSCLATMKDEWIGLKLRTDIALRRRCAQKAMLVEEFVERNWGEHPARIEPSLDKPAVVYHGHCHQKALWGEAASAGMLRRLADVTVLPSGCCGMAGSFGYMADKYEVSMKVGELSLFDAVRGAPADAWIVAPGTSCRHQIRDGTGRRALHPIELAAKLLLKR